MTRYENKEYNFLKSYYEQFMKNKLGNRFSDENYFCSRAMDLLDEYHIKDIQYRERIKTLKEVLRMMKEV